ncbi:MAG TPA: MFS transporter [Anaerolineae bacterium]|nr:MFS transporter [Anaerolineae bacterium]
MKESHPTGLRSHLAAFFSLRLILNTGFRMLYPFLPAFARGAGVSVNTIAAAITARSSLGVAAPLLGPAVDRWGRKFGMLFGLILFSAAMGVMVIWQSYTALLASLLLVGLSKVIFDPAMQSFLGDHVDYTRRGLAIALTEFGWSGSFLLGMPLIGWLMARWGWRAPFPFLGVLGLLGMFALWILLPAERVSPSDHLRFSQPWRIVLANPTVLAALSVSLIVSTAYDNVAIVYGLWMEQSFGLHLVALGATSALIGVGEFSGEGLVAGLSDRLGKRRTVAWGIALAAGACVVLPLMGSTLPGALIALFLIYVAFEVAVVSAIPMMTELAPAARATVMAGNVAALSLGRALGASLGTALFSRGIWLNCITSAGLALLAMAILLLFVRVE